MVNRFVCGYLKMYHFFVLMEHTIFSCIGMSQGHYFDYCFIDYIDIFKSSFYSLNSSKPLCRYNWSRSCGPHLWWLQRLLRCMVFGIIYCLLNDSRSLLCFSWCFDFATFYCSQWFCILLPFPFSEYVVPRYLGRVKVC